MSLNDAPSIKAEVTNDPTAIGYGAWTSLVDDQRIFGLLTDASKRAFGSVVVASWRVLNCFDPTEFASRTALQQAQLTTILSAGLLDLSNANIRAIMAAIFPVSGPTRTSLIALWNAQTQTQSRAAELGLLITLADVTYARTGVPT